MNYRVDVWQQGSSWFAECTPTERVPWQPLPFQSTFCQRREFHTDHQALTWVAEHLQEHARHRLAMASRAAGS